MTEEQAKPTKEELAQAVKIVNEAIRAEEEKLKKIASTEEQAPIMIEGTTSAGYCCQLMASPKDAARIMLDYNYPTWKVLEEEAPCGMWEDLGRKFGLESVSSIDL